MAARRILIVEDDGPIRELLAFGLRAAGLEVAEAANGVSARLQIADRHPDLMLIDCTLPDSCGRELARTLRREEQTRHLPIIILAAPPIRADDPGNGRVEDVLVKPVSPQLLLHRIGAALRRAPGGIDELLEADELILDATGHRVSVRDEPVRLGPTEYRLLHFLMSHPERAFARRQLLDRVWGGNAYVEERTVDVQIRRLRKALAPFGSDRLIQTVRGTGYRFSTRRN
jgi:two-component system phosphate regulon response regulator PhoB